LETFEPKGFARSLSLPNQLPNGDSAQTYWAKEPEILIDIAKQAIDTWNVDKGGQGRKN
jgi:hypothetical protein